MQSRQKKAHSSGKHDSNVGTLRRNSDAFDFEIAHFMFSLDLIGIETQHRYGAFVISEIYLSIHIVDINAGHF